MPQTACRWPIAHSYDHGETWVDEHEDDELFDGPDASFHAVREFTVRVILFWLPHVAGCGAEGAGKDWLARFNLAWVMEAENMKSLAKLAAA